MSDEQSPTKIAIREARAGLNALQDEFARALPAQIPPERFGRVVMTAIQNNPDLVTKCSRQSLWNACMRAAQDGLLPDGREGAIVRYKDQAQWMPMIGGIRKKARNSGALANWEAHVVYSNDQFDFELGDEPYIKHKPALGERGDIVAAYSVATFKDGTKSREVMSIKEIEGIKSKSRAEKGPWNDPIFFPEMCKKVVARRHSKVLPMSSDLDDLIRRDDHLYDLDGAKSEHEQKRPRSLAGALDRLAAPKNDRDEVPANAPDLTRDDGGEVIEGEIVERNDQQQTQKLPLPHQDPEGFLAMLDKELPGIKTVEGLNSVYDALVDPHKKAIFPSDLTEIDQRFAKRHEELKGSQS